MGDGLPDVATVRLDGIQSPSQPVIVELDGWDAQGADQHRLCQPIGHLVEGQRHGQTVEDQHQRHRTVVDLGLRGTVAVDDVLDLERLQPR